MLYPLKETFPKWTRDYWGLIIIGAFFLLSISYVLVRGENIYIPIHDNLDSNIAWYKMLHDNNALLRQVQFPFLGGLERNYMGSEFNLYTWLYVIFPPFYAYVIGWFLKILLAIAGSVFLGKSLCDSIQNHFNIIVLCGFLYGILPTFPTAAFSFASLPLLLGILIRLYRKPTKIYYIFLFLYPIFSSFAIFGIFIIGYIFLAFVIDCIWTRKLKKHLILAIFLVSLGYVIAEWRLFYIVFFSNEETIRATISASYTNHLGQVIYLVLSAFAKGHYHSGDLHGKVVLPVVLIFGVYNNICYLQRKQYKRSIRDPYNWCLCLIILNSLAYGFSSYQPFMNGIAALIPPLDGFSFARALWFNPFLWYFDFTLVLCRISWRSIKYLLFILAMAIICMEFSEYNHIYINLHPQDQTSIHTDGTTGLLTYQEFYSEQLFERVKKEIGYKGEWSLAYGMHPAILQYNGIKTLDGYFSFYPQSYKEKFRVLMEPEFSIDEEHRLYFENWGGRAYAFSPDITYKPVREMAPESANFYIDINQFADMEGTYIFSRVQILNAEKMDLGLIGVFTDEMSPYSIYVYNYK